MCWSGLELAVELTGDVALEATSDLAVGLAFGARPFGVDAGTRVALEPGHHDGVYGAVELAVTEPREPVAAGLP